MNITPATWNHSDLFFHVDLEKNVCQATDEGDQASLLWSWLELPYL